MLEYPVKKIFLSKARQIAQKRICELPSKTEGIERLATEREIACVTRKADKKKSMAVDSEEENKKEPALPRIAVAS